MEGQQIMDRRVADLLQYFDDNVPMYYVDDTQCGTRTDKEVMNDVVYKVIDLKNAIMHYPDILPERKQTDDTKCSMNWEAECRRFEDLFNESEVKVRELKTMCNNYMVEIDRLRTIVKTFEFVYGRKFED